jgi:hypothetical protein
VLALSIASAATAQWVPGSELVGQRVKVQTEGVENVVTFERDGVAQISSPSGATVVDATWTADGQQMCLKTSTTYDCYPYAQPFEANRPVDLLSTCGVRSRWLALLPVGERGLRLQSSPVAFGHCEPH